jgi:predicted metal-binding protein
MAHIPTEQEDVDAYSRIVKKTKLKGSSFSSMLTMNKEDFKDTFKKFSHLLLSHHCSHEEGLTSSSSSSSSSLTMRSGVGAV